MPHNQEDHHDEKPAVIWVDDNGVPYAHGYLSGAMRPGPDGLNIHLDLQVQFVGETKRRSIDDLVKPEAYEDLKKQVSLLAPLHVDNRKN